MLKKIELLLRAIVILCAVLILAFCLVTPAVGKDTKPKATKAGDTTTIKLPGDVPLEMVEIPKGSFSMGDNDKPDESPAHTVTIDYTFQISKFEVTEKQWFAVMNDITKEKPSDHTDLPKFHVSWDDCQSFITTLNALGLGTFRLPSEAEWEYACRANTTTRWSHGDIENELEKYAWYAVNSNSVAHVVGQKKPNPFGLHDMHGNVWEWCQDSWHDSYDGAPSNGSAWESGGNRVIRGGVCDWVAPFLRSSYRAYAAPSTRYNNYGLRLVREK